VLCALKTSIWQWYNGRRLHARLLTPAIKNLILMFMPLPCNFIDTQVLRLCKVYMQPATTGQLQCYFFIVIYVTPNLAFYVFL